MQVAIGNDHAGLPLKQAVLEELARLGCQVEDLGTNDTPSVDFPDYAGRVGHAIQTGRAARGILICGSGVGMAIAANKLHGVRASIAHDIYSAHQGVEHDGMNVLCLGSRVIGDAVARELVAAFIGAEFQAEDRFKRRLDKVAAMEQSGLGSAD
jgi:ribose 5-phosphate isomerase B